MSEIDRQAEKRQAQHDVLQILDDMSTLLVCLNFKSFGPRLSRTDWDYSQGTGLSRQELAYCIVLIESGVDPKALAVRVVFIHIDPALMRTYPYRTRFKRRGLVGRNEAQERVYESNVNRDFCLEVDVHGHETQQRTSNFRGSRSIAIAMRSSLTTTTTTRQQDLDA